MPRDDKPSPFDADGVRRFWRHVAIALAAREKKWADLADELGVSRQHLSQYKNLSRMPNSRRLMQICEILLVSPEFLMGVDDVDAQVEAVLTNQVVPKTARQLYLDQFSTPPLRR